MSQIKTIPMNRVESKVFVKQNNFFAGIINSERRIFYHVPRSSKNIFHLFGFEGLGINEEILLRKDFDKIKIQFNDEILETTRLKWLREGIASPYCNALVDKQIILPITKINLKEIYEKDNNLDLFSEVV